MKDHIKKTIDVSTGVLIGTMTGFLLGMVICVAEFAILFPVWAVLDQFDIVGKDITVLTFFFPVAPITLLLSVLGMAIWGVIDKWDLD